MNQLALSFAPNAKAAPTAIVAQVCPDFQENTVIISVKDLL